MRRLSTIAMLATTLALGTAHAALVPRRGYSAPATTASSAPSSAAVSHGWTIPNLYVMSNALQGGLFYVLGANYSSASPGGYAIFIVNETTGRVVWQDTLPAWNGTLQATYDSNLDILPGGDYLIRWTSDTASGQVLSGALSRFQKSTLRRLWSTASPPGFGDTGVARDGVSYNVPDSGKLQAVDVTNGTVYSVVELPHAADEPSEFAPVIATPAGGPAVVLQQYNSRVVAFTLADPKAPQVLWGSEPETYSATIMAVTPDSTTILCILGLGGARLQFTAVDVLTGVRRKAIQPALVNARPLAATNAIGFFSVVGSAAQNPPGYATLNLTTMSVISTWVSAADSLLMCGMATDGSAFVCVTLSNGISGPRQWGSVVLDPATGLEVQRTAPAATLPPGLYVEGGDKAIAVVPSSDGTHYNVYPTAYYQFAQLRVPRPAGL